MLNLDFLENIEATNRGLNVYNCSGERCGPGALTSDFGIFCQFCEG